MTTTPIGVAVPAWSGAPRSPEAGPRYVLRHEHWGSLVYDRETCQYMPFDREATARLLEAPAGRAPRDRSERAFLERMRVEEILDGEGRLAARVCRDRSHPDRVSAPLTVYLGATQGCNLACRHCQVSAGPGSDARMSGETLARLFREMHDMGCLQASVSGGEPLLRDDLEEALDEGFRLGVNVFLTTNGTLVDEARAAKLAARPFRSIGVSIDGPDAETHDLVRGRGAFAQALAGLRALAALRPVSIVTTLLATNVARIAEVVRLAEAVGARGVVVRPGLPAGRARPEGGLLLDHESWRRAQEDLARLAQDAGVALLFPPLVPHQNTSAFVLERFGCVAGNLVVSITEGGTVSPCALLGPEFDAGTLAERSLEDLWANGGSFRRLRVLRGNAQCDSCRHYDTCGGGCRARSLASGRGLDDPDTWCAYEPLDGVTPVRLPLAPGVSG